MEKRNPKYKVGDKVEFNFDGNTWIGVITDLYEYPSGWDYKIYDMWHAESDILSLIE